MYQINNVAAVGATATLNWVLFTDAPAPSSNYDVDDTAVIDWNCNDAGAGGDNPDRRRRVRTGESGTFVPTIANNAYQDARQWTKWNDASLVVDMNSMPNAFRTTFDLGDGDIPTDVMYGYQATANPPTTCAPPGADDGYPFVVGEDDWVSSMWIHADGSHLGITGDHEQMKNFEWEVNQNISSYNPYTASSNFTTNVLNQNFAVTEVEYNMIYWRTYHSSYGQLMCDNNPAGDCTGAGDSGDGVYAKPDTYWWNNSVKSWVRRLDGANYVGFEDWGLVNYESRNVSAVVNTFSDGGSGFNIQVTITNNEATAGNFNILALVLDMDATTSDAGLPYFNGRTVFPAMNSLTSIGSAIQTTGSLNPSSSTTVTWSNVGTSTSGRDYQLWCMGATANVTGN